jgi:hypothetical protein
MQRYLNLNRDSSVAAYEIGPDSITVQFTDGGFYLYNYESAGREKVEKMKALAMAGKGLNSYIMLNAKTLYARKWR